MTRKHGRDESIEHLLKSSLQESPQPAASGSCPDAEILAAWTDGVLEGRELTTTREHVANCVSCQATLAVLARTAPADPRPLPWRQRVPSIRWVVPVAATATALAIWVAVPRDQYTQPAQPTAIESVSEVSQSESLQVAAQPPAAADDSANRAAIAPSPAAASTAQRKVETAQKADAKEGFERQDSAAPAREEVAAASPEPTADAAAGALARQEAGAAPAAPPTPSAPGAQPAAPSPGQAGGLAAGRGGLFSRVFRSVIVASPGTMLRWRLGNAGSVEYSNDAGRTWEARSTGVDADLVAGASPSGSVCWIVGRSGTVLLTINGTDWQRVTSPTTLDLTAVEPTDARTAIVTAANGRRFRTADAGMTWEPL